VFKIRDDPRLTRVGRLIRKLSIDELPQLMNVIAGQMSLVGPRPPLPEEYATYDPRARRRLSVRPGLTCIWQVSGRSDLDFRRWVDMDLEYIDTWSFGQDLKLLLLTIPAVLSGRGAY
jgi:lipopolysaccharide/colanic/teichoic acid biosynthesis glycosyltransferase